MIRILDLHGTALAAAEAGLVDHGATLELTGLKLGKGRLLDYYFGRGQRSVMIDAGGVLLRGRLTTSWADGNRRWRIQLIQVPAPPVARPVPTNPDRVLA